MNVHQNEKTKFEYTYCDSDMYNCCFVFGDGSDSPQKPSDPGINKQVLQKTTQFAVSIDILKIDIVSLQGQ